MPIDSENKFEVSSTIDKKIYLKRALLPSTAISAEDAILLAAWLVNVAEPKSKLKFKDAFKEVTGG